jgi:hypothetical protein
MAFAVNTPKGQVRLMDLPLDVFCRIEEETGLRYVDVLLGPASTAKTATVVYRLACETTESEPETLTPAMLIADPPVFQLVDDDLPDVVVYCARRVNWPPDVVRRQSLRDLKLLNDSEA